MRASPPWWSRQWLAALLLRVALVVAALVAALVMALWGPVATAVAAPGLCVGPVCGDTFSRSEAYPWQLRLRVQDQRGHRERLVVDCRDGAISPLRGPVERGYAAAVGKQACRLAPLTPLPPASDRQPPPRGAVARHATDPPG